MSHICSAILIKTNSLSLPVIIAILLHSMTKKNMKNIVFRNIQESRPIGAVLAGVLERIHKMDLRETAIGLLGIDAMESLLKLRALVILAS